MNAPLPIAPAVLREFCIEALHNTAVPRPEAALTADALVEADAFGVFTHGTKLLSGYLRRLKAGGFNAEARPRIQREGPGWAIVDGQSALGQVTGVFAMDLAIQKARTQGIAYVGVDYSNHFGAAGHYALRAARAGMIGWAVCNDVPSVAAPGSRGPVTGTNPLAYALPAGDRDPIFFDAAISTVAGGRVYAAKARGEPIPGDWLIGPDGRPTTDAALYPAQASLAPMAGHKGYGLALLIEALSSLLTGAAMTHQVGSWIFGDLSRPTRHGAAFLALDAATMAGEEAFQTRVAKLIDEIHATPAAPGIERVLVPGEREWRAYRRAQHGGIPLPADVVEKLVEAAREARLSPTWLPRS